VFHSGASVKEDKISQKQVTANIFSEGFFPSAKIYVKNEVKVLIYA